MSRLNINIRSAHTFGLALLLAALPLAARAQVPVMPYDGAGQIQPVYPAADHVSMVPAGAMSDAGQAETSFAPVDVNPLPNLPRPADQPGSLYQPAQPGLPYGCPDRECPYLQEDPLLDCWGTARPGWLFDVELDYLDSYVNQQVGNFYQPLAAPIPAAAPLAISLPMAHLNWELAPRFELGYRLPSGFGELDVAYRFLLASGSSPGDVSLITPSGVTDEGAATLTSHLQLRVFDIDYASNETSLETMLGPGWGMKWRFGLRFADTIFNSRGNESPADAIGGFYQESFSNHAWGIGPHAAIELSKCWRDSGLKVVSRVDGGLLFGKTTQEFSDLSTAPGGSAAFAFSNDQNMAMLSAFLGLSWSPCSAPRLDLQLGYTSEYWWNVGRMSDPDMYNGGTAGEFGLNGVCFRLQYNY